MSDNSNIPSFGSKAEELQYLANNRWPNGEISCPRCASADIVSQNKRVDTGLYRCRACAKNNNHMIFNAATGTPLMGFQLPLAGIMLISREMNKGREGMSMREMAQQLNTTHVSIINTCRKLGELFTKQEGYLLGEFAPTCAGKVRTRRKGKEYYHPLPDPAPTVEQVAETTEPASAPLGIDGTPKRTGDLPAMSP